MMLPDFLLTQIAVQVGSVFATIAVLKAGQRYLEKRVDKTETKLDDLPKTYVPRTEVELGLRGLHDTAEKTYALVQASFGGGRSFHAQAQADLPCETNLQAAALPYDAISEERLGLVHPELARRVRAAMDTLAAKGTFFRVAQGLRTYAEQDHLYAQGRTAPGHIVTHAEGGYSNHNFGCAVDCFPFLSGPSGAINWDDRSPQFKAMVDALRAEGLVWGGLWQGDRADPPHFQLSGVAVTPTSADREAFLHGGLPAVWALLPSQLT